jgi:DNA-binding beta-propeller fold protein YncE
VYVTDWGNNRIQKFDAGGTFLLSWGHSGTGDGEFDHPEGIAITSDHSIYVVDSGNHRVQKFGTPVPVEPATWGKIKRRFIVRPEDSNSP